MTKPGANRARNQNQLGNSWDQGETGCLRGAEITLEMSLEKEGATLPGFCPFLASPASPPTGWSKMQGSLRNEGAGAAYPTHSPSPSPDSESSREGWQLDRKANRQIRCPSSWQPHELGAINPHFPYGKTEAWGEVNLVCGRTPIWNQIPPILELKCITDMLFSQCRWELRS